MSEGAVEAGRRPRATSPAPPVAASTDAVTLVRPPTPGPGPGAGAVTVPSRAQDQPVRVTAAPVPVGASFLAPPAVGPVLPDLAPVGLPVVGPLLLAVPDAIGAAPTPAVGGPAPTEPQLLRISDRFVQVPGKPGLYPVVPGAPMDPDALVVLLRLALGARAATRRAMSIHPAVGLVQMLTADEPPLDVPEVLRLGDRDSWVSARAAFETAAGEPLLTALRRDLSARELGAAIPRLRGVVPTADLVAVWSGTFSTDVPGILRALERMPDVEALGLVAEYRTLQGLTGTAALALASTVESLLKGEEGGTYRALRALAERFRRLSAVTGPDVTADDREAARDLSGEMRVRAAFARIQEADRRGRADWAYLAVVDLDRRERDGLDISYLSGWRGRYLTGERRLTLESLVTTAADDVDRILGTLERSSYEARAERRDESPLGLEAAATALGPALRALAARASDPTLSDDERLRARERLDALAHDEDVVGRVLALPGGEKLARTGLGLSQGAVARRRVLRATSVSQVVDALRGLSGLDVSLILSRPDVEAHLTREELQINPAVRRVLDAYSEVQGARPEPLVPLAPGMQLTLPGLGGTDLEEDADLAPVVAAPGALRLTLPGEPAAGDPLVVVAAYEAYRAAKGDDVAGVMAAVRGLRPSQRALLQDDEFFRAALEALRAQRTDAATTVATVLADPTRSLDEAATALVAGGLEGAPGQAFDVRDERMLVEGLAVDPADRRLLRYRYVLDELGEEDRLAGVTSYLDRRVALGARGVPLEMPLPDRLETAYSDRRYAIDRLDPTPRLRLEEGFLGEPEVTRADLTPEEAALEAQFMRLRLDKQLAALSRGVDASGVLGWSPETLTELTEEFRRRWDLFAADGRWTHEELVQLAAAYYDALDAVDRNRSERSSVAEFVGTLAATVAGVVVIVASAGTATPLVVAMLAGAALGAGASVAVADAFRDYTPPDQALVDLGHGAVTGALTVAGQALAEPVGAVVSRQTAALAAKGAVNKALAGAARLAVEGAIDGAVGGAGDAVFATAIDKRTWEHGVAAVFARFLSAAVEGAFFGGLTGAVASPVIGGAVAGTGKLVGAARRLVEKAGVTGVPAGAAAGLEHVAALADAGRFDVALRRLDELTDLSGADRELVTQELYRRALASGAEGADVAPDMLRRLDEARRVTRGLEAETGPARPGESRARLDVRPVEDLLRRLEKDLGPAELTHVRKILYGEIRMAPEDLLVHQAEFGRGLRDALDTLLTPAERAALPPVEVRVLPPEAFEGMFRTSQGRALTIVEGDVAVVYVRSDAPVRAQMLQEAAHLRQLTDPDLAAEVRMLSEANVLDWAGRAAEDRLALVRLQQRLEIDAQERIIAALEREAPYATDAAEAGLELTTARDRLAVLRDHEAQARALTATDLAEMNAGVRRRPAWLEQEPRLFGEEVLEARPATTMEELRRDARPVTSSSVKLGRGERAFQLGEEWTKTTYTTSGVEGTVSGIADLEGAKVVTVTPDSGGEPRLYVVDSGDVLVGVGDRVGRTGREARLGVETQRYRLVEVRRPGGAEPRLREEVLDVRGRWVERGTSRTTRGTVLEEAAELQSTARMAAAVERRSAAARPGRTSVRRWFKVDLPPQRRGFDRVFVELRGDGADTVAVIRVLEVKDYPGSYVPFAEFTAITDNFATNWAQVKGLLQAQVKQLAAEGDAAAASALQRAIDDKAMQVEVWLGPTTLMGAETGVDSVLGRLRTSLGGQGPNVTLAPGRPTRVNASWQREALARRTGGAAPSGPGP